MSGAGAAGSPEAERRGRWLLVAGALAGIALTAWGLVGSGDGGAPREGAVALVNGQPLPREAFDRFVEAVAAERKTAVLPLEERQRMLDRLIDEELLVQRGLELGLARHDRRVRGDIVSAVIQLVVQQAETSDPSRADLERFYEENRDYFTRTGRVFVRQLWFRTGGGRSDEEVLARASEAARRLREGEDFETVKRELADEPVAPLPADFLPAAKLREYVGPTATRAVLDLAPGGVSDPVRGSGGQRVLVLVDREEGYVPPLDEIQREVEAEWVRRAGEDALRRYLDELRERADLRVADPLPNPFPGPSDTES